MQYMPTLGGILRLQKRLDQIGFSLPKFETNIYDKQKFVVVLPIIEGCRHVSGPGQAVDLEVLAKLEGERKEVFDCRLTNGRLVLEFVHPRHTPMVYAGLFGYIREDWVHLEGNLSKEEDAELTKKISTEEIFNLARWGKTNPTRWDRFLLKFLPWLYKFPEFA